MPDWDWGWYEADSGTETVPLLLSIRSQQLALSALNKMDSRFAWVEVDDATWDDIEEAIAEAYEEIMEPQIVNETLVGVRVIRTTNQAIAANVAEFLDWNNKEDETGVELWDAGATDEFNIPADYAGWYEISGVITFQASTSSQKVLRVYIDGNIRYLQVFTSAAQFSMHFTYSWYSVGGQKVEVEVLSPTAVTLTGGTDGQHTCSLVRIAAP